MIVMVLGVVTECNGDKVTILDHTTKKTVEGVVKDTGLYINKGDSGIFSGVWKLGEWHIEKLDIKKFLQPLYEEDILKVSSMIGFLDPPNSPFKKYF